jgi:hypothetical protein
LDTKLSSLIAVGNHQRNDAAAKIREKNGFVESELND